MKGATRQRVRGSLNFAASAGTSSVEKHVWRFTVSLSPSPMLRLSLAVPS
jgi:hypothetical protein